MWPLAASLIMRQLAAYPRQNGIAAALRELGPLERTLFTLDWINDPDLRRTTGQEPNKGEARNSAWRVQSSFIVWAKSATAHTRISGTVSPFSIFSDRHHPLGHAISGACGNCLTSDRGRPRPSADPPVAARMGTCESET